MRTKSGSTIVVMMDVSSPANSNHSIRKVETRITTKDTKQN